jgi:hypothetical protein
MRRLLEERAPIYALADIAVPSRDGPHQALVGEIIGALDAFLDVKLDASPDEKDEV